MQAQGQLESSGDGGSYISAQLNYPEGVAVDSSNGNTFIVDTVNNKIRLVTKSTGIITTYAGSGIQGSIGDGGPATSAQLYWPNGVAVDTLYVYISDQYNNKIRLVTKSTGIITTYAGTGTYGSIGDGGAAISAQFASPYGIALDSLYVYIADTFNNRIRLVTKSTGIITTFAGTGIYGSSGDSGPATVAQLYGPQGIAVDNLYVYIVDSGNNKIRLVTKSTGIITTLAGTGTAGMIGDGGAATNAQLSGPQGIAVDSSGFVYITDTGNHKIRIIKAVCVGVTYSYLRGSQCTTTPPPTPAPSQVHEICVLPCM